MSVVAVLVLMAIGAGSSSAMRFVTSSPRHFTAAPVITAKQHEGQQFPDLSYTSGNITTYKEGDTINFRFDLTATDTSTGQLQVRFTENDGTCLFFDNYFVLGATENVSGASPTVAVATGPTADSGEWVVTLNIDFAAAGEAIVNYQLKLSNQAGDCNGSSQHSRLSPGTGVSQTGQQNVPVPANQIIELPSITVAKLVDRADGAGFVAASAGEYCFTLDGGTCTPIDSSGQVVFAKVTDGAHTITESANLAQSGYTFDSGTGTNCTFSQGTATATVAQGTTATNATCTFKNKLTAPPKVTVTKSCPQGAADADDRFQIQLNGSNAGTALACGGTVDVNPTAGQAYTITEVAGNGTTNLGDYTSSSSGGCAGTLNFGGTNTCTITNTLKALPTVTVTKDCDPNAGADADDRFQFTNNGNNVAADPVACEGSRTITLQPGAAFNFDEVAGNGTTTLADYTKTRSGGCTDSDGLQRGETGTCTITNTLKAAPTVTVTKDCVPNGGADASDRFQITNNAGSTGEPIACEGTLLLTLQRGASFDINEVAGNGTTDLTNYTESRSAGCTDADGLQRGETGTCTITNTLKAAPTVTVNKVCQIKAGSGDRFQVKLNDSNVGQSPLDCGGSLDVAVTAGSAYAITEGAAGTTDLANYTSTLSEGCSGTLANFGDTATCTITNTLKSAPKVSVTKLCPNGKANQGDLFQVKRNGTNVGTPLDCGEDANDHTDVTVTAGVAYTITEGAAGTSDLANYTTTFSEGCSGTLAHFGDSARCTITNTLKAAPKLTVIKHVVNDNGGTQNAGNFTLTVTGSSPTPASFAGSEAGTVVTLQPGPYAVNEAAVSGYSTSKSAGCAGSLAHFGDTATCTVTNDDVAAPPPPPPPGGAPEIDLAITKTDSPDPVSGGALLTYTLTVTNTKGDTANNVVVTDSLPSAVTFVSVSSTKGSCTGTNPISCNIGTVAFNELVSIMIVVRPSNPGTITNTAVVTGREHEHDPSNNTASATTLVQGAFVPPSVCYALTVTPRTLTVGRSTIVRVVVREAGKPVKGVRVIITGRGVTKRTNTNAGGLARFVIMGRSPGILQIRVPSHATCRTQRIGVLGVFTPPVTG
ncbi:MAG: DUF11 domain-containing protein [Actinobacteria bacterium]|nr:MAG: DUF11 domain-containing protein [Actinomycetota bacterium]